MRCMMCLHMDPILFDKLKRLEAIAPADLAAIERVVDLCLAEHKKLTVNLIREAVRQPPALAMRISR